MAPNNAREKPVSREKIVYKHLFYCVKIVRKYLIIQVYWAIFLRNIDAYSNKSSFGIRLILVTFVLSISTHFQKLYICIYRSTLETLQNSYIENHCNTNQ